MQTDEYTAKRLFPEIVRRISDELDLDYRSYSDEWVIELSRGDHVRRIIGYTFDINSAATTAIARDKVATYQLLATRNIPAVPHYLMRTKAGRYQLPTEIANMNVVIKPLNGTSGHGVRRFSSSQELLTHLDQSNIEAWAISPYLEIEREVRTIVLDGVPLLSYEKIQNSSEPLKLFNLGQGAVPKSYEIDNTVRLLALDATSAIGLRLAVVDCVYLSSGEWQILEVNSTLAMEYYARTSPQHEAHAYDVYQAVIRAMMTP